MTSAHIIMLVTIAIYLIGMVAIGVYCSKSNETVGDFYLGGRKMGPLVTAMSAEAADMSSWLLMGLPGLAYLAGIAEPAWTAIGLAIGTYVNWLIVAKRLRNYSQIAGNSITVPDFFSNRFKEKKKVILGICAVGIPASIQNLLNVTGMTILNNFTADFSSDAVAAMGISHKVNMIPLQIALGISQGIMPLISYNYSAKNYKRMKAFLLFTTKIVLSLMSAVAVLYFIFSRQISAFFIDTQSVIDYSSVFLRGMCICLPFICMDFMAVGVFQSCGMGKKALVFAVLRKIVFEIPLLYLLNHFFPLYGLAWAQTVSEIILAIIAVIVLVRMFRGFERKTL